MPGSKSDASRHSYHWNDITYVEARVRALESLMIDKGLATPDVVDAVVATFENDIGPMNGAKVIAKAWVDPAYKAELLTDGTKAIDKLGYRGLQTEHVVAVENTAQEHHMVVCTLCSCYPWTLLGIPPHWFKAPQYRSKAVINPREVLAEFGVTLKPDVSIRVWDSSAEIRYLVVPQRPAGTDGWDEDKLAKLVTRDAMIGTGMPREASALS
jgi:nitrile hydratase subunit alpha